MKPLVALRLGRISNLPTVWSNTLAGAVMAGGEPWRLVTLLTAAGASLLYVGGMYLNDAFDREIDARERPERPIPSGLVTANAVFASGFGLILLGLGLVLWAAAEADAGWKPLLAGLLLGGAILFYDWSHKGNPLGPFFMGLCRALVYVTAGYVATRAPASDLYAAAVASWCYLLGLTYIAKQETLDQLGSIWPLLFLAAPLLWSLQYLPLGSRPLIAASGAVLLVILISLYLLKRRSKGDIARAVMVLIAGISLVDALYLARVDAGTSAAAFFCFLATLGMQAWIKGT